MAVHWRVYHYAYRSQYKVRYDTGESQRQVHRAVPGPVPLVILTEADVQNPVQRVLDPPMTAYPSQILLRRRGRAADEVTDLNARHTVDHPMADHHHDRRQSGPKARVSNPLRIGDHTATAGLL